MTGDPVQLLLEMHSWTGPPEELMASLCGRLLLEAESSVPVDVLVLASLRGAIVEEVEQPDPGWMRWDGVRLVIRVRTQDPEGRKRFTICHEVCHTFFPDFHETDRWRIDTHPGWFDPKEPVEYLCDVGAAELLFPRPAFAARMPSMPTIDRIVALAEEFGAAIESTALRLAGLSPVTGVLVLERNDSGDLAVKRAAGHLEACRDHVVAPDGPLTGAVAEGEVAYRGGIGIVAGTFDVEARNMPYPRDGSEVDRVIVLVHR